jgi:hypothetical protein
MSNARPRVWLVILRGRAAADTRTAEIGAAEAELADVDAAEFVELWLCWRRRRLAVLTVPALLTLLALVAPA